MEEPEDLKPWFITQDGERSGPYSLEELKAKVELHELNPRLDMAWKDGMEDWISAGEVEGLFEKSISAESPEKKDSKKKKDVSDTKSAFEESEFEDEPSNNFEDEEWEGTSRGGFFFFVYIFPVIWYVGLYFGSKMLGGVVPENIIPIVVGCIVFLPVLLCIFAIVQRLQNLAMSRLWFFGIFVPLLNIWLGYRLFACPPGYAEHKRLGALGWILAIIYSLPLIVMIAAGVLVAIKGPEMFNEVIEKNRAQYEEVISKAKQVTETPEEKKAREEEQEAKEKAAKGPSIIPIHR
jgi:hypothetical protein